MSICSLRKGRAVRILAVAGAAALLGTRGALATSLTWDKAGASPTKPVDGAGTWDLTHADWSNGSSDSVWVNGSNIAAFGNANGAAGAITLGTNITAGGLTFNPASSGNYSITGSSQLTLGSNAPITVNSAQATISVPIGGTTNINVAGSGNGSLTLAGTGNYVGQIDVTSGTVIVGSTGALSGNNNFIVASGAAVQVNASTTIKNGFNNSGTVTIAGGQTLTIGTLGFTQNGTLTINGSMLLSSSTATEGAFADNGGTITGTVTFGTAPSEIGFGSTAGPGNFQVNSSSCNVVNDNTGTGIPTGANITMQSPSGVGQLTVNTGYNYNYGNITLTAANNSYAILGTPGNSGPGGTVDYGSIANYGSITLAQAGTAAAYGSQLYATIYNEPTGVVNINTSTTQNGDMDSQGTVNIAAGQTLSFASSYPNFGQLGILNIYGALQMGSGNFDDASGTITGTVTLGYGGMVTFGPSAAPGTFLFTGDLAKLSNWPNTTTIPSGVNIYVQSNSSVQLQLGDYALTNNATLILTAGNKGNCEIFGNLNFTNNGTITLGATTAPTYASEINLSLVNTATGLLNINTSTTTYYGMTNSGTVAIAAGQTLNFAPTSSTAAPTVPFDQIAGTVTVGAAGTLAIPAGQQLEISGGTISLAAGTSPGVVSMASLLWPKPANPLNPATDSASISTTAVSAGQLPGQINLGGAETPFNIADPNGTLTVSASITNGSVDKTGPGTLVLMGSQGFAGALNDDVGTLTIGQGASLSASQITVASGATLNVIGSLAGIAITNHGTVNFPATASGFHAVTVQGLALTSGQKSTVAVAGSTANRTVLELSSLTFGGTSGAWQGLLDLTSNDMVVHGGSVATLNGYISQGYNSGGWNGSGGIISSTAAANHTTALGIELNSAGGGVLLSSFDGQPVTSTDVLIKYTFYGDADLSGTVTGSDYTLIDTGFNNQYNGWQNGDFNYDNVINGNDYTLIDNAFNNQGGITYAAVGAGPSDLIATATEQVVVPEPATLAVIPLAAFLFRRRRVQRQA